MQFLPFNFLFCQNFSFLAFISTFHTHNYFGYIAKKPLNGQWNAKRPLQIYVKFNH